MKLQLTSLVSLGTNASTSDLLVSLATNAPAQEASHRSIPTRVGASDKKNYMHFKCSWRWLEFWTASSEKVRATKPTRGFSPVRPCLPCSEISICNGYYLQGLLTSTYSANTLSHHSSIFTLLLASPPCFPPLLTLSIYAPRSQPPN